MNGHTIYFHDDEFELIVVEAMRRKQTISEYVVWCLRAAPHKLLSVQKDAPPKAKPTPQEEQPSTEAAGRAELARIAPEGPPWEGFHPPE